MEAIRIAEEREASVRQIFNKYDVDKSDTIDMDELLVLLDDLGLLTKLKTEPQEFATDMFVKYDANGDGVLSFEEFKGLYNAAIDDSTGKRKKDAKPVVGKDSKALDGGTLEARRKIAAEKAAKKAEEAERIRKQNAEMKARIMAQGKGKDPKALDTEVETKRREMAEARAAAKAEEKRRIDEENRAFAAKKKSIGAATTNKLSDEENALRAETAARIAAENEAKAKALAEQNKQHSQKLANTGAATVNKLSDEENALREEAAARIAAENEAKAKAVAAENAAMKERLANTGAATDHKLS